MKRLRITIPFWVQFCFLFVSLAFLSSCKSQSERPRANDSVTNSEDLIKNHQMIVQEESNEIDSYISRRGLDMSQTETGLRYRITKSGTGTQPVTDDTHVLIKYSVMLLDGTRVYDSDSTGALEIKIGKSDVATGLQEGLKMMKEGDKAMFIIPSHLAYGLSGDGDKIKYYQALVVNVDSMKILLAP